MNADGDVSRVRRDNPNTSDEQAEAYLDALEMRSDKKDELHARGLSNRLAEKWLDRAGFPRPYGWSSVFYYPGAKQLRYRYLVVIAGLGVFLVYRVVAHG